MELYSSAIAPFNLTASDARMSDWVAGREIYLKQVLSATPKRTVGTIFWKHVSPPDTWSLVTYPHPLLIC